MSTHHQFKAEFHGHKRPKNWVPHQKIKRGRSSALQLVACKREYTRILSFWGPEFLNERIDVNGHYLFKEENSVGVASKAGECKGQRRQHKKRGTADERK